MKKEYNHTMTTDRKELIQYTTAIFGFVSGVVLCVCSFFLNNYEITGSVLGYMGEMIAFCSAVFGLNLYLKGKFVEARAASERYIDRRLAEEERRLNPSDDGDIEEEYTNANNNNKEG